MDEKFQSVASGVPIRFNFWVFPYRRREYLGVFLLFWSLRYGADLDRSRLVSSHYNPHTDRSTFLILTILKSYNSYLPNLKYWRKSLRSSIFTSSKKLKGTKGYALLRVFSALWDFFFEKIFNVSKGYPLRVFSYFATECMLINPKGSPLLHFSAICDFSKKNVLRFLSLRYGYSLRKKARLLQWVVFFSWQSHSEWSTFLTLLTILQFLNFLQSSAYEVVFLYHLRNSTGPKSIFGSVRLFFEKFFFTEGSRKIKIFLIFLDRMDFEKSQMVPPFSFFRHRETF